MLQVRWTPVLRLEELPPSPRSISRMRTFGEAVSGLADVEAALMAFVTRAAEKLRRHDLAASAVAIILSTGSFYHRGSPAVERTRVVTLPAPTNATQVLG